MLEGLDSAPAIARLTEDLLSRADATGQWPTRVDDLVAAAELDEHADSPLSPSWLGRAPKYLRRAVELAGSGKIRALLDRREREVHLDPGIDNKGRRAFLRLHEVSHDLFPWQRALAAFADTNLTLSWRTRRTFEREANQGAAELLFQGDRFRRMARDYAIGMGAVAELSAIVGASLQATLRRYAETHATSVCGIVLEPSPAAGSPLTYRRREVSQSAAWSERFGTHWPTQLSADLFPFLTAIADPEIGRSGDLSWSSVNLEMFAIHAEAIRNQYAVLLLLWVPRRSLLKRRRVLARTI